MSSIAEPDDEKIERLEAEVKRLREALCPSPLQAETAREGGAVIAVTITMAERVYCATKLISGLEFTHMRDEIGLISFFDAMFKKITIGDLKRSKP